jgi:hypothetical protein
MKRIGVAMLLLAAIALVGCGSSSTNPATINGNWNATLTESNSQAYGTLGLSLVVNNDGTLSVTNLTITSPSPCFTSGQTATGSFMLSGNFNGNVTGTFGLTVKSGSPAGDTLTLNGQANGNTISGTWTLGGQYPGCSGNGTFTMTRA